jgi:penicillin-binding protein 1C
VATLQRVGPGRFAAALRSAYAAPRIPARHARDPGLALALGGVGLTLEEVTGLYAALGDDGRARPRVIRLDGPRASPTRLMRPESAARVRDILAGGPAPAGRTPAQLTEGAPVIAFKTGTSYGFRDAWSFGVAGGAAVGVWVGRPDASPRPGETGRSAALPILFAVFDRVGGAESGVRNRPAPAAAAPGLARMETPAAETGPAILFPPDGAEVLVTAFGPDSRGLSLSARGGRGALQWYAEGAPVGREETSGRAVWRPNGPGFYTVSVVDQRGARASARVRVRDR